MSPPAPLQPWLRDVGERSLFTVRYHVLEETRADAEAVFPTISRDVFFAVPERTRTGHEIPPGTVLTRYEEVCDYYSGRLDSYAVLDSRPLRTLARDWYVFNDSAATLRGTGSIGDADASGAEFIVNSAILFPTADDGIRGEICVTRHPFADVVQGLAPNLSVEDASYPAREMRHSALLDSFVDALRSGDEASVGERLSPAHTLAFRLDAIDGSPTVSTARDRADAQKILSTAFRDANDIAIVSRIATDWYVFAEYLADLGGGRIRRFASTHPIEDGLFTGTFGYGRDERVAE
jgi:hypothetical protein